MEKSGRTMLAKIWDQHVIARMSEDTDLLHVEFEHALRINVDDRRESYNPHTWLLAHDIRDDIPFDASAHRYSTAV